MEAGPDLSSNSCISWPGVRMVARDWVVGRGDGWQEGREGEEMSRWVEGGQQAGTETCLREWVLGRRKVNRIHNIILCCIHFNSSAHHSLCDSEPKFQIHFQFSSIVSYLYSN